MSRLIAGVCLCLCLTFVLPCAAPAADSGDREGPKAATHELAIPRDQEEELIYRLPAGHCLVEDSLSVTMEGQELSEVDSEEPGAGEYRLLFGVAVLFSEADRGKRTTVTYKYTQARAALLPVINQTDIDYMGSCLEETARETLTRLGFHVIPARESKLALSACRISFDPVLTGTGEVPSAERVSVLGDMLKASYLVIASVKSFQTEKKSEIAITVHMAIFDGKSGALLLDRERQEADALWTVIQSKSGLRKKLVQNAASGLLTEYFE
jgi:hypothetical protein